MDDYFYFYFILFKRDLVIIRDIVLMVIFD